MITTKQDLSGPLGKGPAMLVKLDAHLALPLEKS